MSFFRSAALVSVVASAAIPVAAQTLEPGNAQMAPTLFELAGHAVTVEGGLGPFELSVERRIVEPGVEIAHLRLRSVDPAAPPHFTLRWSLPARDIHGHWTSGSGFQKALAPDWAWSRVSSTLARNAPVMTLFGSNDGNRLTFAASDALNTVILSAGLMEEDARAHASMDFFTERHRAVSEVSIEVRFDSRDIPFHESLSDVSAWWAAHPGYEPAPVPEIARLPMYSTWYSYHQSVSVDALLREVEASKAMGYEAIIIDDGWQTLDSQRGYAFTGDWEPERIPEMKQFVDAVHDRGMKLLLWYSMPLVGERSEAYQRFRGKYLRYWNGQGAYGLDPRYPDVREHLIDTYRTAMRAWGVDGFKLDFLSFFTADDSTQLELGDGRDYASVSEATDRLMTDVMTQLRAVEPDVMIEFRQPYIGPLMRKYGNMFRAGDAPNAVVDNRVRTVDLRLLAGNTAVHSDMLMWHPDEPVETAALQLLNVLFSVPQLSVRLEEIPTEHRRMVRFWTAYWRANRATLLDGRFVPRAPMSNYPLVSAHGDAKSIFAAYGDVVVPLSASVPTRIVDIVNARASERVVVDASEDLGRYRFAIHDALGRELETGFLDLTRGAHGFDVPPSGLLSLQRGM